MLNKIEILGSSSAGCAYILHFEQCRVQLDAGIRHNKVKDIDYLFISHGMGHKDHDKYFNDFVRLLSKSDTKGLGKKYDANFVSNIKSFPIQHAVENYGYYFECENEKIAYITDCGDQSKIDFPYQDLTYLFIECNGDYFLVKQKIINVRKHADYAFSSLGHMSNLDCLNFLARININKDCKIIFIHKSNHHANYETTYKMFDSLPNKKFIAKAGETIYCKSGVIV